MKDGKSFEVFVKNLLMCYGFFEVESDGIYIYNGSPGQMINGFGEAHNADVLLEPPVQIPFSYSTRLLIECKDYNHKVGLDIVRSVLALKQDINNFNILTDDDLKVRKSNIRSNVYSEMNRYVYQVVLASTNGFTMPAQKFAVAYRIPLISFDKMPFWSDFVELCRVYRTADDFEEKIIQFAKDVGKKTALAVTNFGQLLILQLQNASGVDFDSSSTYSLHWQSDNKEIWELRLGDNLYKFQLPSEIMKKWISDSQDDLRIRKTAINCKENDLSNMIVYYQKDNKPQIKMISIDRSALEHAKQLLGDE